VASVRLDGEGASAQLRQASPAVCLALEQLDLVHVASTGPVDQGSVNAASTAARSLAATRFHGVSLGAIPRRAVTMYDKEYPYAWLGILAAVAPSNEELTYVRHDRGFVLHSMRSPQITRLYLQVDPDVDLGERSDDRIWGDLQARLETKDGFVVESGPILEKAITSMRSFVVEPMQYRRLYLVGDAAHIVPPTGAKGMNLAIADARVLAEAMAAWYSTGSSFALEAYSATCLRRVWRAEHFSWWMTTMLHRHADDPFMDRLGLSNLRYVISSESAARTLAENYVGLETV
jgi:p-hydroxybenzoate 3-monooxygenase